MKEYSDPPADRIGKLAPGTGIPVGQKVPDIHARDLDGKDVSLSSLYTNGPILLAFTGADGARSVRKAIGALMVLVTDWLPALQVNKMADLAVIHGGIGTVMTAALAGKPVVGVGMQIEQVANLACLERLGFALRVPKSRDPSAKVQKAIERLLHDDAAKEKAAAFASRIAEWDGPKLATRKLVEQFAARRS